MSVHPVAKAQAKIGDVQFDVEILSAGTVYKVAAKNGFVFMCDKTELTPLNDEAREMLK